MHTCSIRCDGVMWECLHTCAQIEQYIHSLGLGARGKRESNAAAAVEERGESDRGGKERKKKGKKRAQKGDEERGEGREGEERVAPPNGSDGVGNTTRSSAQLARSSGQPVGVEKQLLSLSAKVHSKLLVSPDSELPWFNQVRGVKGR